MGTAEGVAQDIMDAALWLSNGAPVVFHAIGAERSKPLEQRILGGRADVHPARVGQIESGRVVPYPPEIGRLADALEYEGEPEDLIREVES